MKPFISFVIPIYTVEKEYFEKCLRSVLDQDYNNFECILLFDGSPSDIIEFAKKIVDDDKRFNIVIRENKGVSYTRNEGIKKAKGKWIMFIDADDWIETDTCSFFEKEILKYDENINFVMLKNYINNSNGQSKANENFNENLVFDDSNIKELYYSTYGLKNTKIKYCESVWKNFYDREFLNKYNIVFDHDLKIGEDLLFNYDVWNNCSKGLFFNKYIYHYRINENSVMNSNFQNVKDKYMLLFPKYELKIKTLKKQFQMGYELFVIRQLERFCLNYYYSDQFKIKEFKELINDNYIKEKIKKSKLFYLDFKHMLFLLNLKLKFYYIIGLMCGKVNKRRR